MGEIGVGGKKDRQIRETEMEGEKGGKVAGKWGKGSKRAEDRGILRGPTNLAKLYRPRASNHLVGL